MTPEAALASLADLVAPPEQPTRPAEIDWSDFAHRNGFEAPADYRLLMDRYGVGGFGTGALTGGWLYTLDPFSDEASLVDLSDWDRRNSRGFQRHFPDQFPGWPMWPEQGGLLPWANSADGDLIGWWTTGEPDAWGTRFFGRDTDYESFTFGAVEFILRLLTGALGAPGLDGRFAPLEPGETLQFFPHVGDAGRDRGRSVENVTVSFAGLATVIDLATMPSPAEIFLDHDPERMRLAHEAYAKRFEEVMRPADEIIQSWRTKAANLGLKVGGVGTHREAYGHPYYHQLSCSFDPSIEPVAKRLIVDLSMQLGVAITEVRNLEYERIWEDISMPR
jgi:hypothetical protein